jgi:hypothetical protein
MIMIFKSIALVKAPIMPSAEVKGASDLHPAPTSEAANLDLRPPRDFHLRT